MLWRPSGHSVLCWQEASSPETARRLVVSNESISPEISGKVEQWLGHFAWRFLLLLLHQAPRHEVQLERSRAQVQKVRSPQPAPRWLAFWAEHLQSPSCALLSLSVNESPMYLFIFKHFECFCTKHKCEISLQSGQTDTPSMCHRTFNRGAHLGPDLVKI